MKDNFSERAEDYRKFRPDYPDKVYEFMCKHLSGFELAWDCGTGNGQVAASISEFIGRVEATDISEKQLENAIQRENIYYSKIPAERTYFANSQFDLIIAAQAVHWFNFRDFYIEVKRCLKPNGLFVIMGYSLFRSNLATNAIIEDFYSNIIGTFWDKERGYLEDQYLSIPFPFSEIKTPVFEQKYHWTFEHLIGYLRTWSAVKHYKKEHQRDPVLLIESSLKKAFGESNEVIFPILLRLGKLP